MTDTAVTHLRRRPSQDRSAQRFESILDTTAQLIDEVGYAAITISLIAKRSAMSGPAVYRYFDDLQSIARSLAARNLERFVERAVAMLSDNPTWQGALQGTVIAYSEMFRHEPGFRWLRLGDAVDRNLISTEAGNRMIFSAMVAELFVEQFDVDPRADLVEHVEVIVEISDALIARAFHSEPDGDQFYLDQCTEIITGYLGDYLAKPYPKL